jgi:RNA polymerase sigma factor (TIGR02999 family)
MSSSGGNAPDTRITEIINAVRNGDAGAGERLMPAIHAQLRRIAAAKLACERSGQTLQATALVHEAWLRLGDNSFENRSHFFGAAAEAMRRILVDRARRKKCAKHGSGANDLDLDGLDIAAPVDGDELLAVHDALDRLAAHDSRKAELVKLRYFAGLSFDECAALMSISVPTAKRDWRYARAWLHHEIKGD